MTALMGDAKKYDLSTDLGEVIEDIDAKRASLSISQADWEKDGVISKGGLSRIKRCERSPSIQTLVAMANSVGLRLTLTLEEK